jgi:hypothetical protein
MDLSADQQAEAQRLFDALQGPFLAEARRLAELLASKPNAELLGKTEFDLRDALHRLGATALQAALDGREKGATKARAWPARTTRPTPAARASATASP